VDSNAADSHNFQAEQQGAQAMKWREKEQLLWAKHNELRGQVEALQAENDKLCILVAWLNTNRPVWISTKRVSQALGLSTVDWEPLLEMVAAAQKRGLALAEERLKGVEGG
jgi:hypothetical protein